MNTTGTVISNGKQAACYGSGVTVAAGSSATICEFSAPKESNVYGLSLGLGLDNVAAWGTGAAFAVYVGGLEVVTFTDQISDLLRPEFLPVEIKGGESVRIDCFNGSASPIVAAAFARLETF